MSSQLGQVEPFDESSADWTSYEERLQAFLRANKVPVEQQADTLISMVGPKTYALLKSLTSPEIPTKKSFEQLLELLRSHFVPKLSIIGERAKFHRRSQLPQETTAQYAAELRRLAQTCEFGTFLDQALRDRFVCGLLRADIQRNLFAEDNQLKFQTAVDRAIAIEAAIQSASATRSTPPTEYDVHKVNSTEQTSASCYRCGSWKHAANSCRYMNAKCFQCNKKGHIKRACRSRQFKESPGKHKRHVRTLALPHSNLQSVKAAAEVRAKPIMVEVTINDLPVNMELDTGAAVSVMSVSQFRSLFPSAQFRRTSLTLRTYTNERVKPCGVAFVAVQCNAQTQRLPLYVLRQDGQPLLGRNWLQHLQLDWTQIQGLRHMQLGKTSSSEKSPELESLLSRYQDLFKDELGTVKGEKATLFLKDEARPKFFKARSVPFALKTAVEHELTKLQELGIITPITTSPYATPVVPVVKRDGSVRLCGDYKVTLNPILDIERYPLPKADELFAALAGGKHFSKIDLSRAYQQVEMDDESKQYLTLNTHKGLFLVNRLPFGISSAPAIFQRIMDNALKGLNSVTCYLDDILITGRTEAEHLSNLEAVLKRLSERGMRLKLSKCDFFRDELQYLGHVITKDGVRPTDEKLVAITNAPTPKDKQQLQSLLGLINYYGKFVPNLSSILFPLNKLLRKNEAWEWNAACQSALVHVKKLLTSKPILTHYNPSWPVQLSCDASAYGIGAVLSHILQGQVHPIAYASRTLTKAEQGYSQLEKEALALVFGVKRFHYYVYARNFTLLTDHKPLETIFGPKTGIPAIAAARLQRWAVTLSAYAFSLQYRPSAQNVDADCLSRLPLQQPGRDAAEENFLLLRLDSMPVCSKQIAEETARDPVFRQVVQHICQAGRLTCLQT